MIPLPEKVFMTGEAAETAARGFFDLIGSTPDPDDPKSADLEAVLDELSTWRGPISVRTRLVEGRRYKSLLGRQERPDEVVRVLRMSHLPHWVWVVEFHERQARDEDPTSACVRAEIVLDSTAHDDLPILDLIATVSGAGDAALERSNEDSGYSDADGDGKMWRSLITDPELLDDEYLMADSPGPQPDASVTTESDVGQVARGA